MKVDIDYAVYRLYKQYGGRKRRWGEHPEYVLHIWQTEAERGHTKLGYWPWVVSKILTEEPEVDDCVEREIQLTVFPTDSLALQVNTSEAEILAKAGIVVRMNGVTDDHDEYTVEEWLDYVLCDMTRRGYLSWLAARLKGDNGESGYEEEDDE